MKSHRERHLASRGGWLRAAVLGADDGVVSTASLMMGVASASGAKSAVLIAGIAGLVAGALSMAAGEYVSVSSQRDAENADIAREKEELAADPKGELEELVGIYRKRGLDDDLARKVAEQLSARKSNQLKVHMHEELGLDAESLARPFQAAIVSAASFSALAALPIVALIFAPLAFRVAAIAIVSLLSLAILGAIGGHLGGAKVVRASFRVVAGGGIAMGITALIGHLLGVVGVG